MSQRLRKTLGRTPRGLLALAGLVVVGSLLLSVAVRAHTPEQTYDLSWWTVDGGGETFSTGSGYSLGGTAGQPDAGQLVGGGYTLGGGFWGGGAVAAVVYRVYLPLSFR